jgi:uncharacterized membrane-anchored protein YhcB (DUF1043 family)
MRIKKELVIPAAVGVTSFASGVGVGYFLILRKFRKETEQINKEIEELESEKVQLDFQHVEIVREFNLVVQQCARVLRDLKEQMQVLDSRDDKDDYSILLAKTNHPSFVELESEDEQTDDDNVVNIFSTEDDEDWDYEKELAQRNHDAPYVIHRDEYFGDEYNCTQTTITYYAGDNILCDERDTPIYNPEKIVGQLIFGHGSNDPNVVYVRNEKLDAEYEVLLDHGHYQVEILGQQIDQELAAQDLKHAHSVLKFRRE